ncbi:hypothetical protein D3C75_720930 [compost metagenome]
MADLIPQQGLRAGTAENFRLKIAGIRTCFFQPEVYVFGFFFCAKLAVIVLHSLTGLLICQKAVLAQQLQPGLSTLACALPVPGPKSPYAHIQQPFSCSYPFGRIKNIQPLASPHPV